MRNFHKDFESLNQAYDQSIRSRTETQTIHESVSQDIDNIHRAGSIKQLREALNKLADAHTKDHSSLTYEDVVAEIKAYAEEKINPTIPAITTPPTSSMHNEPVTGLAQEEAHGDDHEDEDEDKEKVDETTHSPENSCKDDEYYCYEDKECKKKVGENFDKLLDLLKISDHVQTESEDDDEHDQDKEEIEEDMASFMKKPMQPGGDSKATLSSSDVQMVGNLASAAGGPTGNALQKMIGQDGPTKIRKAYGGLMGAVADKLNKATAQLKKNNPS